MPPLKNVKSLQASAMDCFANQLAMSISSLVNGRYYLKKQSAAANQLRTSSVKLKSSKPLRATMVVPTMEIQKMKKFVSDNVPKALRTELFHVVLKSVAQILLVTTKASKKGKKVSKVSFSDTVSQLDKGIMYVFSLLMCKEVTELDFTVVLHLAMKWVDTCRLNNTDPKEKQLDYTRIEIIFLKHFAENTKVMTNLVSLTWPHLISGDLIRIIGRHLQNLRVLILACSCETGPFIEEERKGTGKVGGSQEDVINSLKSLYKRSPGDFTMNSTCGCPYLKKIVLPNLDDEEGKAAEIISEALLVLKKLEVVSGISTLLSLSNLQKTNFSASLSLKNLNDYDPFKQRIMPDVEFLKAMVPQLESIELRVSEDITKRIVTLFYDIKEVSIDCPSFHTIAKKFSCLIYINISLDFNCPWPLLLILSKYCKPLKYLTLEHSTFKIDPQNLEQMRYPRMTNLIQLKLIRSSFIEFIALHVFIKGCQQLSELDITLSNDRNYMVDEFGDELIAAISPHMQQLEKFTAECLYKFNLYLHLNCTLTIEAAKTLIQHCPKLRFIGHLDSWDVNEDDVKNLTSEIKNNNWDMELA